MPRRIVGELFSIRGRSTLSRLQGQVLDGLLEK